MAAKAVDAHLRYLERDGVTRDGEKGRVYSAGEDEADGRAFIARGWKNAISSASSWRPKIPPR